MRDGFVFILLMALQAPLLSQQSRYQQVQYRIEVTLDDRHHSLTGSLQLQYGNQSSDTLYYLWFQLWPNAFKNDRTAYSGQLLDSGRNDFYFSGKEQKGYINRMVFRSDNEVLSYMDHPRHSDIIKVNLAHPLPPGKTVTVSTPFHVRLPYDFSGFGHIGQQYHLQNWYPAVAMLDGSGWHPEPFLGQHPKTIAAYRVTITLPRNYFLQTNGQLADSAAADTLKTLTYRAQGVPDFLWMAEKPGTKHPAHKKNFEERMAEATPMILSKKILPAAGYNVYDGFQIGAVIHNFHIPENKFTWFATPLYATRSKTITGFAGVNYNLAPNSHFKKISIGFNGSLFSDRKGSDSAGRKIYGSFSKISPYIRVNLPSSHLHEDNWAELRTFIIGEQGFEYVRYAADSFYYPVKGQTTIRWLNQLTVSHASFRSLYPYDVQLQIQQASSFYRINAEAHYFFNYPDGGGLQTRLFAAKFGYIGHASASETFRYQPKLTAVRGAEDYTYSNSFAGRNEFEGLASQQIMLRDGGLKLRTDLFQDLQGRSDNWIASMNFSSSLPAAIFPHGFPLKIFLDAGTYAGAWKKESPNPRFLYVSGLQLSFYKDLFNIYAPVFYSKLFRENLKTAPEENTFLKRISFSLDLGSLIVPSAPQP